MNICTQIFVSINSRIHFYKMGTNQLNSECDILGTDHPRTNVAGDGSVYQTNLRL